MPHRPGPCRGIRLWCCLAASATGGGPLAAALHVTVLPEALQALFVLPLYDIGLAPGAVLSLNLSNARPSNHTVLVLLSHAQWSAWVDTTKDQRFWPPLGGAYTSYLVSHWRQPFSESLIVSYTISAPKPERYYVVLLNPLQEVMVMQGTISYVNPDGQHLPLQMSNMPDMLWLAAVAFVLLLLAMVLLLSSVWQAEATLLHALLAVCLWLKSAELVLKWKYFQALNLAGEAPLWLLQLFRMSSKAHEIVEILFLLITALGWRVLRPRLTATEVRFAALAMALAATLATLQVCLDSGPSRPSVVSFRLLFYVVRVMCYLVIIFAMNFNLQLISLHLTESPVTESVAVLYRKQQAYVGFRRIFLAMVFRPSAKLWLSLSVLQEEGTQWAVEACGEIWDWALYAALLVTLRPGVAQPRLLRLVRALAAGSVQAAAPRESREPRPPRAPPPLLGPRTLTPAGEVPYVRLASG